MKTRISMILLTALFFLGSLFGCSSQSTSNVSLADTYRNIAQESVDAGDLDTAIQVLEEGTAKLKDEELAAMLESVQKMKEESAKTEAAVTTKASVKATTTAPAAASDENLAAVYLDMAQDFIASDDINSAKNVLEKGIKETQDKELIKLLEELNQEGDYTQFIGSWAEETLYSDGGMCLDIFTLEGDAGYSLLIDLYFYEGTDANGKIAYISEEFSASDIKKNVLTINYTDDNWGNSGTLVITAHDDSLECEVKDVEYDTSALWAVWEGEYKLIPMDSIPEPEINYEDSNYYVGYDTTYETDKLLIKPNYVYWEDGNLIAECYIINGYSHTINNINIETLSISNDEGVIASGSFGLLQGLTLEPYTYKVWKLRFMSDNINMPDALLPEYLYFNWSESHDSVSTGDKLTASSILANLGMTESEFRSSCIFLTETSKTEDGYRERNPHVSIEELKAYPNEYIGMHFVIEPKAYAIEYILDGSRQYNDIEVLAKKTTSDGYFYYETTVYDKANSLNVWEMLDMMVGVIDLRDDPYSPNISDGDTFIPYMIFVGIQNNVPVFQMISADVYFE